MMIEMRGFYFLVILVFSMVCRPVFAMSEEERLRGFIEHQRQSRRFNQVRESGAAEVKKQRQEWSEKLSKSVGEYKLWKSRQGSALNEFSREYLLDLQTKEKQKQEQEKLRQEFLRERKTAQARRKSRIHVSEDEELGLVEEKTQEEPDPFLFSEQSLVDLPEPEKKSVEPSNDSASGENFDPENSDSPYYLPEPEPPPPEAYEQQAPPLGDIYEEEGVEPPPVREFIDPSPPLEPEDGLDY